MQYILDSVWGAGGIRTFGTETLEIINLVYPSSVEPGVGFQVTYSARNNSAASVNAYGYIINTQTGAQYGYWESPVAVGGSYPSVVNMPGISSTFYGEIRIGHIEGPISCTNPAGADGDFVCGNPAYGNTPVEGRRYECTETGWIDLGVDPVNCPIGGEEVLVTVPEPPVEQGSVTGAGLYSPGELVTLVAYPAAGWSFAGWTGDITGGGATLQFYMPDHNITVNANFRQGMAINWMMVGAAIAAVSVVGIVFLVGKR